MRCAARGPSRLFCAVQAPVNSRLHSSLRKGGLPLQSFMACSALVRHQSLHQAITKAHLGPKSPNFRCPLPLHTAPPVQLSGKPHLQSGTPAVSALCCLLSCMQRSLQRLLFWVG